MADSATAVTAKHKPLTGLQLPVIERFAPLTSGTNLPQVPIDDTPPPTPSPTDSKQLTLGDASKNLAAATNGAVLATPQKQGGTVHTNSLFSTKTPLSPTSTSSVISKNTASSPVGRRESMFLSKTFSFRSKSKPNLNGAAKRQAAAEENKPSTPKGPPPPQIPVLGTIDSTFEDDLFKSIK